MRSQFLVVAVAAALLCCNGVHSRSIQAETEAVAEEQAVEKAAEILTVEAVGEAIKEAMKEEVAKELMEEEAEVDAAVDALAQQSVNNILAEKDDAEPAIVVPAAQAIMTMDNPVSELTFETGTADNDGESVRSKRTIGNIGRIASCLFTVLINPNCLQELRLGGGGGGGGGLFRGLLGGRSSGSSRSSARQEAYNRQLRQWIAYQKMQIAKLNATEDGNYTTPFPILPPSPPPPEDDDVTEAPQGGIISQVIQFKLNLIPNLFRTARSLFQSILPFIQNLTSGGGGGGGLLSGVFGNRGGSSYSNDYSSSSYQSELPSSGGTETATYRISLG